jgi:3-hydroxyacyl-CoA dehydrogenase
MDSPAQPTEAQRYLASAEEAAAQHPALIGQRGSVPVRAPENVAIVGAGTMGIGIAMCFANAGIPAVIIDTQGEATARAVTAIEKQYASSVVKGRLTPDEQQRRIGRITTATSLSAAQDADLIVEAVFEDMAVKKAVFRELDGIAKADAVLATNTSYLDVNDIAASTKRPQAVIGLHFFSPAHVMRLLEIVNAEATDPAILAAMFALGKRLGKVPVIVGVCRGFVGNRMLQVRSATIEQCLLDGALPDEVDAALVGFGFAMGPLAASDLAGLDISWRMRKANGLRAEIADALCDAGRFGVKTRQGYYRYDAGARRGLSDPAVTTMIEQASARRGLVRRAMAADEIIKRVLDPMIDEGRHILKEGIAHRASDIDLIWVHGYAFPAARGGPMYYADQFKRPS